MAKIQYRRGTAAQWTSANPILAAGEPGFETDTGKQKIGNGTDHWTDLAYIPTGTVDEPTPAAQTTGTQAQLTTYLATLASGTEYVWNLTDGSGNLTDILSGKKP